MSQGALPSAIGTLFFVFTFFSVGESAFEAHVNYPAWLHISDESFLAYHRALSARIGILIVPLVVSTLLTIALLFWRPRAVPAWSVWTMLVLQVVAWTSSVFIQIPIQMQLSSDGYSVDLLQRLITTDLLYRKVPSYLRLLIAIWLLFRVIEDGRVKVPDTR
jgi:hypothetical protein